MLKNLWDRAIVKTLANQDLRYIDMYGGKPDASGLQNFLRSPTTKTLSLATLPMAIQDIASEKYANAGVTFLGTLVNAAMTDWFCKGFVNNFCSDPEAQALNNAGPENLVIDKNGKGARVISYTPHYDEAAKHLRNYFGVCAGFATCIAPFAQQKIQIIHSDLAKIISLEGFLHFFMLSLVPATISGYYRFHKVSKGDWAIIDKKQEGQTKKLDAPDALRDLT